MNIVNPLHCGNTGTKTCRSMCLGILENWSNKLKGRIGGTTWGSTHTGSEMPSSLEKVGPECRRPQHARTSHERELDFKTLCDQL